MSASPESIATRSFVPSTHTRLRHGMPVLLLFASSDFTARLAAFRVARELHLGLLCCDTAADLERLTRLTHPELIVAERGIASSLAPAGSSADRPWIVARLQREGRSHVVSDVAEAPDRFLAIARIAARFLQSSKNLPFHFRPHSNSSVTLRSVAL